MTMMTNFCYRGIYRRYRVSRSSNRRCWGPKTN